MSLYLQTHFFPRIYIKCTLYQYLFYYHHLDLVNYSIISKYHNQNISLTETENFSRSPVVDELTGAYNTIIKTLGIFSFITTQTRLDQPYRILTHQGLRVTIEKNLLQRMMIALGCLRPQDNCAT